MRRKEAILRPSTITALLSQRFQLVHELVDVFELAVDRGETNIGDLIQLMKLFHQLFTDDPALDFGFAHFLNAFLDAIRHVFDGGGTDRPFFAGLLEAGENFCTVERLPAAVLLHHHGKDFLDTFVGGVATLAAETFAAAANHLAFLRHARVDDLVFEFIAERTFHRR